MSIEAMADALIERACMDAFGGSYLVPVPRQVEEAWIFLTASGGGWAQARNDWCDIAGRNADNLRRTSLARHAEHLAALAKSRGLQLARNAEQYRRARMKDKAA